MSARLIDRTSAESVEARLAESPIVALLGARQVGKTTLARQVAARQARTVHWFDLEDPADVARLHDPGLALRNLQGLVVIDEIQRRPDLFPLLRVLGDRPDTPARFLILWSAAPELLKQSSETLAGRVSFVHLEPLRGVEVGESELARLWLRGGFPRAFLASDDRASLRWRSDFVATFLERDLPQLGIGVAAPMMRRFWTMLAHLHGQTWNGSRLARGLGVADTTVRRYVDHLEATFMVRTLQPWHVNVGKRQVKSPKVYVSDSGLAHALLGIATQEELERHPQLGASWEGFALQEIVQSVGAPWRHCHFWATHGGAELDLLIDWGGRRRGFEIKRSEAPTPTRSMHIALEDLQLDELIVVHAGTGAWPMAERIRALGLRDLIAETRAG